MSERKCERRVSSVFIHEFVETESTCEQSYIVKKYIENNIPKSKQPYRG